MPYCDDPLDRDKVGESVYIDILYHADWYVHIMTPYLILDGELDHLPETAFSYVGTIEEAIEKGEKELAQAAK